MAEPKFIRGPYEVDPDFRAGMAYNRHIVLARDPNKRICFMAHDGPTRDAEFKATADLLAAAPDLYEALAEMCRQFTSGNPDQRDAISRARDALDKARGDA